MNKYFNKKTFEITALSLILSFVTINAYFVKDNPIAVVSALAGILYTLLAGSGRVLCYYFGLTGSFCYSYLAFHNGLFGNVILYMCYYVPMQVLGIFKWKSNLKEDKNVIKKRKLTTEERLKLLILGSLGSLLTIAILYFLNDKNPILDGITTFFSILGMYLTVQRAIEQWLVWMIVNSLSFLMWLNVLLNGEKVFSTVVMWGVYLVAAFYFYFSWKKELKEEN